MRTDVRRLIAAGGLIWLASILAVGGIGLVGCGTQGREQIEKAANEARVKVNQYCDARQKAIEALGTAGAE